MLQWVHRIRNSVACDQDASTSSWACNVSTWQVAQDKHIGRPKGLNAENLAKVKKPLKKGRSAAETLTPPGISLPSVKRYRKHLQAVLSQYPDSSRGLE